MTPFYEVQRIIVPTPSSYNYLYRFFNLKTSKRTNTDEVPTFSMGAKDQMRMLHTNK